MENISIEELEKVKKELESKKFTLGFQILHLKLQQNETIGKALLYIFARSLENECFFKIEVEKESQSAYDKLIAYYKARNIYLNKDPCVANIIYNEKIAYYENEFSFDINYSINEEDHIPTKCSLKICPALYTLEQVRKDIDFYIDSYMHSNKS